MTEDEDPLRAFDNLASCPSCSAFAPKGTTRCPECGAFHMHIEDAETRISEEERRPTEAIPEEPRDPGFYSVNPRGEIPVEHFEGDEEAITDWEGASIDFGLGEEE